MKTIASFALCIASFAACAVDSPSQEDLDSEWDADLQEIAATGKADLSAHIKQFGQLQPGQPSAEIKLTGTPKYGAVTVNATAGEKLSISITARCEDRIIATITGARYQRIAATPAALAPVCDRTAGTITTTLTAQSVPVTGTYSLLFRDSAADAAATMTVEVSR